MDALDRMINNVDQTIISISEPFQHFHENRDRYLSIAKTITQQTLTLLKPIDTGDEDWKRYSTHFINAITAAALSNGLSISYKGRSEENQLSDNNSPDAITLADIREWVVAGAEGDPEGKDITKADINPETGEIDVDFTAEKLFNGISDDYNGRVDYSGIRRRVEEWIESGTELIFADLLQAILTAWEVGLTPIIENDYSKYLDKIIKNL